MSLGQGFILFGFLIPLGIMLLISIIGALYEEDKKYRTEKWRLRKAFRKQNEEYAKQEFLYKLHHRLYGLIK